MNIFKKGPKPPAQLVSNAKDQLQTLEQKANAKAVKNATEEISKILIAMKGILYGEQEKEPNAELSQQLADSIYEADILLPLIVHMTNFEFEARKDVAQVFNNLLRKVVNGKVPAVDYVLRNPQILDELIEGYEVSDIAINSGSMLRECIKHEDLAKKLLYSPSFYKFFTFVEVSNFDVASDAFATFKDLVTTHKDLAAEFLFNNYDKVFALYTALLSSENYVTRRVSIKLLGELLLDRANFNIMTRYISDSKNLKLMMTLLRDKSKNIQYEAFHVFKVFVANPNKPKGILDILIKNKRKLIPFLENFQPERDEPQFKDEKAYLLKQIESLTAAQ